MKLTSRTKPFLIVLIAALLLVGSAGAAYYVKKGGQPNDITLRAARLQKTELDLEFLKSDLSRLQQSLEAQPQGRILSDETQILRERISGEQAGIETELMRITEDAGYLRRHWAALTPSQKDLVDSVQKNLT